MNTNLVKTRFLTICLLLITLGMATQLNAKVFEAYDYDSFKAAIDSVNAGNGGDIIKITGDIVLSKTSDWIYNDVTITADTNPDGTPKYTITGITSQTTIVCRPKKSCTIENIIVENGYNGLYIMLNDCEENPVVKIDNCIATNHGNNGIIAAYYYSSGQKNHKILITNCISNNNYYGIDIANSVTTGDITIQNCTTNYNKGQGISTAKELSDTHVNNCVSNYNDSDGFDLGSNCVITNCTANNNSQGFDLGDKCTISNSTAVESKYFGFYGNSFYASNCMAMNNGYAGFGSWKNLSVFNGCTAIGNGQSEESSIFGSGFYTYRGLFFNSTAAYNNIGDDEDEYYYSGVGFYVEGMIINCTASNNTTGIESSNLSIYNSISYNNSEKDLSGQYSSSNVEVYNTVFFNYYDNNYISKYNCTADNPKLLGRTAAGDYTENKNDLAYYSLGEGSSALELADKSLITREKIFEIIDANDDPDRVMWFKSIVTEDFLVSALLHDQIGTEREFNGDRYDAGAIASNEGGGSSNLIFSYGPKKAANYGKTTIVFYGQNLDNRIKVTLKKQSESDLVPETIKTEYSETTGIYKCSATFSFHNKKIGKWDIIVNLGDTTQLYKEGFEIETYIEPIIELEIYGSPNIRNGGTTTFIVEYSNKGNVEVYGVPIIIEIITPKEIEVDIIEKWKFVYTEGTYTEKTGVVEGEVQKLYVLDDFPVANERTTFVTPLALYIPPYGKGTLSFNVKCTTDGIANHPVEVRAYTLHPLTSNESNGGNADDVLWNCLKTVAKIAWDLAKIPLGAIPGVACAMQVSEGIYSIANTEGSTGYKAANAAAEAGKAISECVTDIPPGAAAVKTAIKMFKTLSTANDLVGHAAGLIECANGMMKLFSQLVGSKDPNDKCGPVSESGSTWMSDRKDFTYVINFENDPKATAP
ncbi:MAG: right-handed parallel beta-helix repeat-containing protein, partial [Bacteroidales bacterium]|nr:right-handed parallel beta-helix repeat-containing protein [Bacteroidales bacterium]